MEVASKVRGEENKQANKKRQKKNPHTLFPIPLRI